MDFFDIKCFLSAAKHLNLSMAAKEMFISQPAMSVKINAIEEEFSTKLFYRTRHKVELTPAGAAVQSGFIHMLDCYDKVKAEARKISLSASNYLSIGYHGPTEWANISELIQTFHLEYPQIEIDVKVGGWGKLTSEVIDGSLDVLFTEQAEVLDIAVLKSIFLFRDYVAVAVSKTGPLSKYAKIKPDLLKNEKIIMSNDQHAVKSMRRIHERLSEAGFDMKNAKLVDHYDVTIAMASAGMGIAPIPRSFKINGHQSVIYVDVDSEKAYEDFVLTWSAENHNPAIPLFRDFCKQREW